MSVLFFIWLMFLAPPAEAGAPPPDVIPWDSVVIVDTVHVGGNVIMEPRVVYFITRTDYERDVLGLDVTADLRDTKQDLRVIKAALRAKKAGNK